MAVQPYSASWPVRGAQLGWIGSWDVAFVGHVSEAWDTF